MKKAKKRFALLVIIALLLWLIGAQVFFKFRTSDEKARQIFRQEGMDIKLSFFSSCSYRLHYAQTGVDSLPTLFFLHGSPHSWDAFLNYMKDKELLQHFRMISIDRPGFGQSNFGKAIDIAQQCQLIAPFLKKIQNGQPVYVVGHSLGGALAVKMAAAFPGSVHGLVLLAASVSPAEERPEHWRAALRVFPLCYFVPGAFRPSNTEIWMFKKDVLTLPNDLRRVRCPVIIMQGMDDKMVPPGNASFAQEKLINAQDVQLYLLKEADHFFVWDRYHEVKVKLMALTEKGDFAIR